MAFGRVKKELTPEQNGSSSGVVPPDVRQVDTWRDAKYRIRSALIDMLDSSDFLDESRNDSVARLRPIVEVIVRDQDLAVATSDLDRMCRELTDEIVGFGPLEQLIARDDIADIMVNGHKTVYIEVNGRVEVAPISFSSDEQLLQICQRIVRQVGRRIDESSPICDARLLDGSRVNVIIPPLAIDGPVLTIRKFKKDRLKLDDLVKFRSITRPGAALLGLVSRVRCNTIISGGTGSGKTTLLNCLTAYIDDGERIVTCEDTAELQLQQRHIVRLETRPPNIEGAGQVTMGDLVKNCLRMRPDRIIVGEVRGSEAFDLLQAMNTGHDGSMGTLHANSPREALFRLESMITASPSGSALPLRAIREMIAGSIDIIVQADRMRDGRRVISSITEVMGIEDGTIVTQELMSFEIEGTTETGAVKGRHVGSGISSPNFLHRADEFGDHDAVLNVLAQINSDG